MEREQRRLVAIVATDVVGYSRLIGQDEEGTLQALRQHRRELFDPLIEQYGGRIANTAGDSLLLDFPSVVDAVRCSLAIQKGLLEVNKNIAEDNRIRLRIGINLGDVIAEGEDLLGDGVNIAARLEALCEPGGLVLSEDAYRQVRDRLDLDWLDGGEHEVKNIARPVHVWFSSLETDAGAASSATEARKASERPAIAALPFDNMSGDPEQEYFSDGITEDIITELSHFSWLKVIARNSSFSFKGQANDLRQVAEQLGVRYILEGSVRKAGNRVRITAQLIDTSDGSHLWAERYDRNLDDIFEVQDEITRAIVGAIAPQMQHVEVSRAQNRRAEDLDCWDLVMRATADLSGYSKEGLERATVLLEKALAMEPDNIMALTSMATTISIGVNFGISESPVEDIQIARDYGRKALKLDNNNTQTMATLGGLALIAGEHRDAYRYCRQAIAGNQNEFLAPGLLGITLICDGQAEEGKAQIEAAFDLSPRDIWATMMHAASSFGEFLTGHYEAGIEAAERSLELSPDSTISLWSRAANYARLDEFEKARADINRVLELNPNFGLAFIKRRPVYSPRLELTEFLEALKLAGAPD